MRLTGRQIVEQGIITGPLEKENIQQIGVDLNLIAVEKLDGLNKGIIPLHGKTKLMPRNKVQLIDVKYFPSLGDNYPRGTEMWILHQGVYDITLAQGCKIPNNCGLRIVQRSSLLRNGALLSSSIFDPGFETQNIGTILHVIEPIIIEYNARIAQAYVDECYEVQHEDMYNGQFQNDKQRKNDKSSI